MTSNNQRRRKPRRRSSFPPSVIPPPVIPAPHPSFLRRQESILPPRPPPVGATLVVARSRRQPVFIPLMWPSQGHGHSRRRACPVPRHGAGIHPLPLRAPSVIPGPHPSFLRRQESILPPRRRGNPCGCPFPPPTRFHPFARPPVIPAEAGIHPLRALCGESSPPPRMQQNATRRDKGTPFSPPTPTSQRGSIVANPSI